MNARITESNNLLGSFFVQLRDDSEIELLQTNDLINLIWDTSKKWSSLEVIAPAILMIASQGLANSTGLTSEDIAWVASRNANPEAKA